MERSPEQLNQEIARLKNRISVLSEQITTILQLLADHAHASDEELLKEMAMNLSSAYSRVESAEFLALPEHIPMFLQEYSIALDAFAIILKDFLAKHQKRAH